MMRGTFFGPCLVFPYVSLILTSFINKEITTHYPSIIRARSYFFHISAFRRITPLPGVFDWGASTPVRRVTSLSLCLTFSLQISHGTIVASWSNFVDWKENFPILLAWYKKKRLSQFWNSLLWSIFRNRNLFIMHCLLMLCELPGQVLVGITPFVSYQLITFTKVSWLDTAFRRKWSTCIADEIARILHLRCIFQECFQFASELLQAAQISRRLFLCQTYIRSTTDSPSVGNTNDIRSQFFVQFGNYFSYSFCSAVERRNDIARSCAHLPVFAEGPSTVFCVRLLSEQCHQTSITPNLSLHFCYRCDSWWYKKRWNELFALGVCVFVYTHHVMRVSSFEELTSQHNLAASMWACALSSKGISRRFNHIFSTTASHFRSARFLSALTRMVYHFNRLPSFTSIVPWMTVDRVVLTYRRCNLLEQVIDTHYLDTSCFVLHGNNVRCGKSVNTYFNHT